MRSLTVYGHGGSSNHGCEAIVRSTSMILPVRLVVYSIYNDDAVYGLPDVVDVRPVRRFRDYSALHYLFRLGAVFAPNRAHYVAYQYRDMLQNAEGFALSTGGDNYCYGRNEILMGLNRSLNRRGVKTILWGASIEPSALCDERLVRDMSRYSLITARESLTFKALVEAGIQDNVRLYPDPAFVMPSEPVALPTGLDLSNCLGVNLSPMVVRYERKKGDVLRSGIRFVSRVLAESNFSVALIPHVVTSWGSDLDVLKSLYREFEGSGRVALIDEDAEYNAMQLKYVISHCRFMIAARTHASIAAYSSEVPTVVIGYSVKARGIAKDIFGTDENYVVPVERLGDEGTLWESFQWMRESEGQIRSHLSMVMPQYIERAWRAGDEVLTLLS